MAVWRLPASNTALTDLAEFIVTTHVACVPEQSPDHPVNTRPLDGFAVSWTTVPLLNDLLVEEHFVLHDSLRGELEIEPYRGFVLATDRR